MATAIQAPYTPSHDLPGLTTGASLCRPNLRPLKYAAVSAIHTIAMAASTSHGDWACNCTSAIHAPSSTTTPTNVMRIAAWVGQRDATHGGASRIQNSDAAPHTR